MPTVAELDIPSPPIERTRGSRPWLWAAACGAYAGALWVVAWGATGGRADFPPTGDEPAPKAVGLAVIWALVGGAAGVPVGPLVWLFRPRRAARTLALLALPPLWGAAGCGLSMGVAALLPAHVDPLLSSSLTVALVSAGVGFAGCHVAARLDGIDAGRSAPSLLAALGWAVSGGACLATAWASVCVAARAALGVPTPVEGATLGADPLFVAAGTVYGLVGGVLVGACRRRNGRAEVAGLGVLGAVSGAFAGLAGQVAFLDGPAPLLGSALAMAAVGCVAGLSAHQFARRPARPPEVPYEEDEADAPGVRVEWLLRERKRAWRISRPLARVLPLLLISAAALVAACFTDPVALVAVAAVGLAAARAIYRQDQRLDELERRNGEGRDMRPEV